MVSTSQACVQKESWTPAKVRPALRHAVAVIIMCELSSECTKFGGNAVLCFCLETCKMILRKLLERNRIYPKIMTLGTSNSMYTIQLQSLSQGELLILQVFLPISQIVQLAYIYMHEARVKYLISEFCLAKILVQLSGGMTVYAWMDQELFLSSKNSR